MQDGARAGGLRALQQREHDHGRGRLDYRGRADVLAVSCPTLDRVFVVPVDDAAGYVTSLRVTPSRNNQRRRVRMADDYAVERWVAEQRRRDAA